MHILILGGTTEASLLARRLADRTDLRVTLSLAGRTQVPVQPVPYRTGGFGGVEGLCAYLATNQITHVVDATHPFAERMSANAVKACATAGIPLIQLSRPGWQRQAGDLWRRVDNVAAAVAALGEKPRRVFLSHGRQIAEFVSAPQHFYLVRTIDPPAGIEQLPHHRLIVARGPFGFEDERALLLDEHIDVLVTKNSGGSATYAKIAAARDLQIPVVIIRRPIPANCAQAASVDEVLAWIEAHSAPL